MKDILFSSWEGQVVDNRDGSKTDSNAHQEIRWPEKLNETEPIKAFMGWDGFVLRSEDVHVVDLCRAYMEAVRNQSCGKCIPCQTGTTVMAKTLEAICNGQGRPSDIVYLRDIAETVHCTAKCGIGKTGPLPILQALTYFPEQFADLVDAKRTLTPGQYHASVTAPCMEACPIHLDIPRYVECIKEGRFQDSLDIIRTRLPIPGIVGRVCVRPCEENCRRANLDEPVSIKYLKRFVADQELAKQQGTRLRNRPVSENRQGCHCRGRTGRCYLCLSSCPEGACRHHI